MISPAVHGGNVYAVARHNNLPIHKLIDYSASINPLGLPPRVRRALVRAIPSSIHYPEPYGDDLRMRIGETYRIDPESIVLGNGSAELISLIPRALSIRHGLVIGPTFAEFQRALALAGARCTYVHAQPKEHYRPPIDRVHKMLSQRKGVSGIKKTGSRGSGRKIDAVFLCNPNSPTGQVITSSLVHQLREVACLDKVRLIVDEAFIDFCSSHSVLKDVAKSGNLIVIRSFTKFFAMPGLRIGFMVAPRETVSRLRESIPPWSVNNLAQAAARAALNDREYRRRSVNFMRQERVRFGRLLRRLPGVRLYPSQANFLLLELPSGCTAVRVAEWCRDKRFLVRDCRDFPGMNAHTLRLAIRRPRENDRLVHVLTQAIDACRS